MQHIHKPIIPRLNYTLIEKKHYASTFKSNIEYKPQQETNKSNIVSKMNTQQQNIQQPNFNVIPPEDYDPLAVTFIEPKNQMSKIISPLTANLEPKSLDLALVNDGFEIFDDEFSDFQCAQFSNNDGKNNQEFTDFQSAFDTLSFKNNTKNIETDVELLTPSIDVASNLFETQQNLISCNDNIHDKYEVFRTLAAETVDIESLTNENNYNNPLDVKPTESIKKDVQSCEVYDDEFGDFLSVEEVSSTKPEIEVDWKNVQVCIFKIIS